MVELLLLAGIAAAAYGLWRTISTSLKPMGLPKGLPSKGNKKEIALEALSAIWARHKNTEISLEQLAGLWRNQTAQPGPAAEGPVFRHPEIQDFYDRYVKGKTADRSASAIPAGAASPAGGVVKEILGLLDREGDCPSVVNGKGESEGFMDQNAYDLLAKVTLFQHSLDVAEEMIKAFNASGAPSPKILIASLGHDLGKLPSYRKTLYSLGDHPLGSLTILEGLPGWNEIPYKDELKRAIVSHHRNPQGLLEEKLKEADMSARRMELARNVKEHVEQSNRPAPGLAMPEAWPPPSSPPAAAPARAPEPAGYPDPARQAEPQTDQGTSPRGTSSQKAAPDSAFAAYAPEKKEVVTLREVPLPWFDPDRFLAELKPYINRLDGARWGAFSMPDGHVYFQAGVLEEVVKKLGKGDPDIALMGADRDLKRNILFSVVSLLRREKEAIARGLVKDGYFGGPFIVRMKDGREVSFYYTPFVAEAFGETVSYFEGLKEEKIREIEEVWPKIQK